MILLKSDRTVFLLNFAKLTMKALRKYTLSLLSAILLLCFSLSVVPIDFFHSHITSKSAGYSCSPDGGPTCEHKNHLALKSNFCWACSVHFEKTFLLNKPVFVYSSPVCVSFTIQHSARIYQLTSIHYSLRGPPIFS